MKKLLVVCGPSGSGKSFLEDKLCAIFPDQYKSLLQYTTRARRPNDHLDTYLFLNSESDVELMKDAGLKIIGETEIMDSRYGTFLNDTLDESVIQTVVLNRMGIDNLKNSPYLDDYEVKILEVVADKSVPVPHRFGRTKEYIEEELKSLEGLADLVLTRTTASFNYHKVNEQIQNLFTSN